MSLDKFKEVANQGRGKFTHSLVKKNVGKVSENCFEVREKPIDFILLK